MDVGVVSGLATALGVGVGEGVGNGPTGDRFDAAGLGAGVGAPRSGVARGLGVALGRGVGAVARGVGRDAGVAEGRGEALLRGLGVGVGVTERRSKLLLPGKVMTRGGGPPCPCAIAPPARIRASAITPRRIGAAFDRNADGKRGGSIWPRP